MIDVRRGATALAFAVVVLLGGCDRTPAAPGPAPAGLTSTQIEQALAAAESYLNGMDLDKAEPILRTLVEKAPDEADGREMLGRVLLIRGARAREAGEDERADRHFAAAFEQYAAAARLVPDSAGLQQSAGEVAHAAGDLGAALAHYERAADLDPANPKHPLFAAQVLLERGDLDAAEARLDDALALDPDTPFAHASLATLALTRDDPAAALDHIARARLGAPDDLGLRAIEARALRAAGEPARVVETLAGLPAADRASEAIAHELAAAYVDLGDPARAAAVWEAAYRRRAGGPDAWRLAVRTGEALLAAGEREQAFIWHREAERQAPRAAEVTALGRALAGETADTGSPPEGSK